MKVELSNSLLIFIGSGFGGMLRYGISQGISLLLSRHFPYGTLIVNVSGAFVMGFLFVLMVEKFNGIGSQLRAFLLIGFLGGYTTFSSFSIETVTLMENGHIGEALLNVGLSVFLCISVAWIGVMFGRQL